MEDIIDYLCKKHNISKTAMRAICDSPFKFIAEEVRSNEFKNINVIGLGKFALKTKYKDPENLQEFLDKNGFKSKTNTGGLEKPDLGKPRDRKIS